MREKTMIKEDEGSSMLLPSTRNVEVSSRFHLQTFQKHLLRKLDKIGVDELQEKSKITY